MAHLQSSSYNEQETCKGCQEDQWEDEELWAYGTCDQGRAARTQHLMFDSKTDDGECHESININYDYNQAWLQYCWQYRAFMAQMFWSQYCFDRDSVERHNQPCRCQCESNDESEHDAEQHGSESKPSTRHTPIRGHKNLKRTRPRSSERYEKSEIKSNVGSKIKPEQQYVNNWNSFSDVHQDVNGASNQSDDDDDYNDGDDFEIELNDEFKKFLEISEKHKQERRKEKAKLKEDKRNTSAKNKNKSIDQSDFEFIDVSEQLLSATTEAPKQIDRMEKYKQMYGNGYEEVLSLEAEINLSFTKFCDSKKPAYWPNIPLKL